LIASIRTNERTIRYQRNIEHIVVHPRRHIRIKMRSLRVALPFILGVGTSPTGAFLAPLSGTTDMTWRRPQFLSNQPLAEDDYRTPPVFTGRGEPQPKRSLEIVGQSHTAKPWILSLIAYAHWAPLLPAVLASYAVFVNSSVWLSYFEYSDLRVMSWMLAPLIMFASTIPPITMHVYEDWQIAPARDPAVESFEPTEFNNDRLRLLSMNMLFCMVAASNFAIIFGYIGNGAILPVLGLAVASTTLKGEANKMLPMDFPDRHLITPTPVGIIGMVIVSTTISILIMHDLGNHILDGNIFAKAATNAALPLVSLGGLYEGFIGETKFNQWDHLRGSLLVLAGNCACAWSFFEIGTKELI